MFGWIRDVCASSGFVQGERWAAEKDHHWQALVAAFAIWWPVTAARALHRKCSLILGRYPALGRWTGRAWIVGGLGVLAWYGPGPVVALSPVALPGLVGAILVFGSAAAFVVLVPRVRGLVVLRPPKAAVLVALLGAVYWALTAVTFHYGFGVDAWSVALWDDIAWVWFGRGNLRWSAFWALVADTAVWLVVVAIVWARAARVWVAVKAWAVWWMKWLLRAAVFGIASYAALRFMAYDGWWQIADELARPLAALPYGFEAVAQAPVWAIAFVLFVCCLVIWNMVSIVLVIVSDALRWVTRMLAIAVYGGRAIPAGHGDVEPRRFIGLLERLDRRQLRATERYQAYLRQRLVAAVESGVTPDGWWEEEDPDIDEAPSQADAPASAERWRRRWWPFGARVPVDGDAACEAQQPAPAPSAAPVPGPAAYGGDGASVDAPPKVADDAPFDSERAPPVVEIADTTQRDKRLEPDPDEEDKTSLEPCVARAGGPLPEGAAAADHTSRDGGDESDADNRWSPRRENPTGEFGQPFATDDAPAHEGGSTEADPDAPVAGALGEDGGTPAHSAEMEQTADGAAGGVMAPGDTEDPAPLGPEPDPGQADLSATSQSGTGGSADVGAGADERLDEPFRGDISSSAQGIGVDGPDSFLTVDQVLSLYPTYHGDSEAYGEEVAPIRRGRR